MPLLDRTAKVLREAISEAASASGWEIEPDEIGIETPRERSHGDLASTIALNLAKRLALNPREVAEELSNNLKKNPPPEDVLPVESVEVAGPGFLNFRFGSSWLESALKDVLYEGEDYGQSRRMSERAILFEFISANPTGPLNVVSARAAAVGDALAAICEAAGARVGREYYINDAGRQVRLLGESLEARVKQHLGEEAGLPEEGYYGDYLVEMAGEFVSEGPTQWWGELEGEERYARLSEWAVGRIVARQRATVEEFGLKYDTWFRESSLHDAGSVDETLGELRSKGHIYEYEGAVWFRSSEFGDEKDRVLVTSDGHPTYLLPDIAYHRDKFSRGWRTLIDLWGPDHHGYIPRMRAALQALGYAPEAFDVLIVQQVNLLRSGEAVKMSKRAGELIEMKELIEEVGPDAARFFFLMRATSTHLDFDLDLAVSANDENPVYYVQYAHARISSILAKARSDGLDVRSKVKGADLSTLEEPEERALLRVVADFPQVVADAAESLEPHRVPSYLRELAATFHPFYHNHRVVGSPPAIEDARLALCTGVRQVLTNGLGLLGVSAPDRM